MCKIGNCLFWDEKNGCCFASSHFVTELLIYAPSTLRGSSKCNRLYYLIRKAKKDLYEKYGYGERSN